MKSKKGISLMVLVITIIVMIILASTVLFISAETTNNSKIAAFASDLDTIEDLVDEYYLNNNTLPVVDENTYNKETLVGLITNGATTLAEEIDSNGDESSTFYKIDLSKLPIESTSVGDDKVGDEADAYYISADSFNVYYLKGAKIAKKYYFSLTKKLTGKVKMDNTENSTDTSNITISGTTKGIKLIKSTSDWTNELTVTVNTEMKTGETIKYKIAGIERTFYTTSIDIANLIKTDSEVSNAFYASDDNKYFVAEKYLDGSLVAKSSIKISNLDTIAGNINTVTISYSNNDSFTLANISGYSDIGGSGVKEARVLYLTKLDDDGATSIPYYDNLPDEITNQYVNNSGKSSSYKAIKLPKDVVSYAIVFIDNAGNISNVKTYTV